mmetsp:Transcript_14483/g.36647  ORF Transcript_14483/g.36647 Transcript_14483/m.36647 type:complete len:218 (-) Transcript_14483:811-1464(-)
MFLGGITDSLLHLLHDALQGEVMVIWSARGIPAQRLELCVQRRHLLTSCVSNVFGGLLQGIYATREFRWDTVGTEGILRLPSPKLLLPLLTSLEQILLMPFYPGCVDACGLLEIIQSARHRGVLPSRLVESLQRLRKVIELLAEEVELFSQSPGLIGLLLLLPLQAMDLYIERPLQRRMRGPSLAHARLQFVGDAFDLSKPYTDLVNVVACLLILGV